jgi:hypothetical protein
MNFGQAASNHDSQLPDATSKEITLSDVMDAVEVLFLIRNNDLSPCVYT